MFQSFGKVFEDTPHQKNIPNYQSQVKEKYKKNNLAPQSIQPIQKIQRNTGQFDLSKDNNPNQQGYQELTITNIEDRKCEELVFSEDIKVSNEVKNMSKQYFDQANQLIQILQQNQFTLIQANQIQVLVQNYWSFLKNSRIDSVIQAYQKLLKFTNKQSSKLQNNGVLSVQNFRSSIESQNFSLKNMNEGNRSSNKEFYDSDLIDMQIHIIIMLLEGVEVQLQNEKKQSENFLQNPLQLQNSDFQKLIQNQKRRSISQIIQLQNLNQNSDQQINAAQFQSKTQQNQLQRTEKQQDIQERKTICQLINQNQNSSIKNQLNISETEIKTTRSLSNPRNVKQQFYQNKLSIQNQNHFTDVQSQLQYIFKTLKEKAKQIKQDLIQTPFKINIQNQKPQRILNQQIPQPQNTQKSPSSISFSPNSEKSYDQSQIKILNKKMFQNQNEHSFSDLNQNQSFTINKEITPQKNGKLKQFKSENKQGDFQQFKRINNVIERASVNLNEKMAKEYDRMSANGNTLPFGNQSQSTLNQDKESNFQIRHTFSPNPQFQPFKGLTINQQNSQENKNKLSLINPLQSNQVKLSKQLNQNDKNSLLNQSYNGNSDIPQFKIFQTFCIQILRQQQYQNEPCSQLISTRSLYTKFCQTLESKLKESQMINSPLIYDINDKSQRQAQIHKLMSQFIKEEIQRQIEDYNMQIKDQQASQEADFKVSQFSAQGKDIVQRESVRNSLFGKKQLNNLQKNIQIGNQIQKETLDQIMRSPIKKRTNNIFSSQSKEKKFRYYQSSQISHRNLEN